jgi:D-3-phosphoglycerate dehydrogenase
LFDEAALLAALRSGRIAGAALDVLSGDSRWGASVPDPPHPLLAYARLNDTLIVTPHVGGYGARSVARARLHVAQRYANSIQRDPP